MLFQSTRPCGARLYDNENNSAYTVVSIHAPLRGATCERPKLIISYLWFQSTRPCGARLLCKPKMKHLVLFQSTRPCGARLISTNFKGGNQYVSIHAPLRGATKSGHTHQQPDRVSIHAPLRGATSFLFAKIVYSKVSIHAPLRGATNRAILISNLIVFQSTRPCGARRQKSCGKMGTIMFQSTRPCGARRALERKGWGYMPVSIHAPLRGATLCVV